MEQAPRFVGIDVAKDHLDLAVRPDQEQWQEPASEEGRQRIVVRLTALQPTLIVLEATGGLKGPSPSPWPRSAQWRWSTRARSAISPRPPAAG